MWHTNKIKSLTVPFNLMLLYSTGPALLCWQLFNFSWPGISFALSHFLFPVYALWTLVNKKTETAHQNDKLLLTLLAISTLLTLATLDQFQQYWLSIKLTWLHLLLIYYHTRILPKLKLAKTGLEPGNLLADFVFEDSDGNPVTRRSISDGPILFYFFRGNWCPFCSAQIAALMADYKQIQSEGIHLAFVSSQPHSEMKKLAVQYELECDYLVDVDFQFASKYHLVHKDAIPPGLAKYGKDTLLPTLLMIDQHNKVILLERTDNFRLRPEPDQVLTRIKELGKNAYLENLVQERTKALYAEKQKSEKIILNILPEHTAIELKETGKTEARYYESVTLLFSDFVGFTRIAATVSPQALVDSLNAYFVEYDKAVADLGLEKIKTIGDAYMVASGLPIKDSEHAKKCAAFAQRMLAIGERLKRQNPEKGLCVFEVRIGMHSGPVMAGVVGEKKFSYDIWGDTVNLAARMESLSEPGRINVSESTRELLEKNAALEARGKIAVKNHQPQQMYFLNG